MPYAVQVEKCADENLIERFRQAVKAYMVYETAIGLWNPLTRGHVRKFIL